MADQSSQPDSTPIQSEPATQVSDDAAHQPIDTSVLKPLRTYENDVAEVLRDRGTSKVAMAIAESRKKGQGESVGSEQETDASGQHHGTGTKMVMLSISLLLLLGGLAGAYFLYSKSPLAGQSPVSTQSQDQQPASLVQADSRVALYIDGLSANDILLKIKSEMSKPQAPGTIKEIVPAKTENGAPYRVSATDMANVMDIPAPGIILRTLQPEWMLGVYSDNAGDKSAFVVVKTDFFQNAFAGMLQWESLMPDDIRRYVYIQPASTYGIPASQPTTTQATTSDTISLAGKISNDTATNTTSDNASSTNASSTFGTNQSVPVFSSLRGSFKDEIVKNKDVRAFISGTGQTIFVYSFVDNSTLVIAENDGALSEIITRLENQAFMR
ncbi:MAG: hypothetical protein KGI49_01330 [Patescibacteria group bacterium]|nr:hypothetical protein [Patescibacteria group bacterium]